MIYSKKKRKKFIITIDTEGDDLWTKKITREGLKPITVRNADNLERFQLLCEKYGFIPTWLVNYEMSQSEVFRNLALDAIKRGTAEVGMHMHAWNCPPIVSLKYNPHGNHPYLGEYARKVQWEKMKYLTYTLQDTFQTSIRSFRNGRWYLDKDILIWLKKLGFIADCTVTPGVSWATNIGNTVYGIDYSKCRFHGCYRLSEKIYEVPPTILNKLSFEKGKMNMKKIWLRPNGENLDEMLEIVKRIRNNPKIDYLEFMLHSSELSPNLNPTFRSQKSIENLYENLDVLFKQVSYHFDGIGLGRYVEKIIDSA